MVSKYNTERKYLEGQENRKEFICFLSDILQNMDTHRHLKKFPKSLAYQKATVQRHMRQLELDGLIATAHPNTPRAFRLVGYEYRKVAEV